MPPTTRSIFTPNPTRRKWLRIAIDGPSGSGKTYTALRFAHGLAESARVGIVDTEKGSATLYLGRVVDGVRWQFKHVELTHYAPSAYKHIIDAAAREIDVLIVDSLSHAWMGTGGALDQVDRKSGQAGGSFSAWRDVTPQHNDMVNAIMGASCHVIATLRTKTEYQIETDEKGKMKPTKIGTKPTQREGVEYEFDIVIDMDIEHVATVSKTRFEEIDGAKAAKPGVALIQPAIDWLAGKEQAKLAEPERYVEVDLRNAQLSTAPATAKVDESSEDKKLDAELAAIGDAVRTYAERMKRVRAGDLSDFAIPTNGNGSLASPALVDQIKRLAASIGMTPEQLKAAVVRRGANRLAELPESSAHEILAKLWAKLPF